MADVDGYLDATETQDSTATVGEVVLDGDLACAESVGVPGLSGWVESWGDLAATEAADASDIAGEVVLDGDLACAESADVPGLSGWVESWGDLAATEAADECDIDGQIVTITAAEPISYTRYTCRLTGSPDLALPISSFASRLRSGSPSYLSVVVPAAADYADGILDRTDGDIVITRTIYDADDTALSSEDICTANLYQVRTDYGASSLSVTLTGYKQVTVTEPQIVYLDGLSYRADDTDESGATTGITVRTRPHNSLLPGQTARIQDADGGWLDIEADLISYSVSVDGEHFEVSGVPA